MVLKSQKKLLVTRILGDTLIKQSEAIKDYVVREFPEKEARRTKKFERGTEIRNMTDAGSNLKRNRSRLLGATVDVVKSN